MAGQLLGWTGGYHIGKGCLETRGWSWSPEWPGASSLMCCGLPTWWGVRLELELSIGWGAEMILTGWLECLLFFNQLPLLWDLMGVSLIMCCLRAKFSVVLLFSALLVVSPACFQNYLLLFSCSVLFNCSLQPHGLQYARLPCPSPSPRVYSNSCPLSQWCHATISSSVLLLPSIFPSIRVFSNESVRRIKWPKYWSFSFSSNPSNEYSGLISSRMDWLDFLEV